jgi:hypothetical protein
MGMMFLLVGAAVALSVWPLWIKSALIVGGLSSILLDIFGWWGVKYGGPAWSYVVMAAGILMAVSFFASVFVTLYDLWLRRDSQLAEGSRQNAEGRVLSAEAAAGKE